MVPTHYAEWKHCITEICGIPLTQAFIEERMAELNDLQHHMTARFVQLYGEAQRQQTLLWFEQAKADEHTR